MSGGSDIVHIQGGSDMNFTDVTKDGHQQIESSYKQATFPIRKQFPSDGSAIQLENIPSAKVIVQNPIGNDPIYVGGLGDQTPYIDKDYPGDYRGMILYEGMAWTFQVDNANKLQVIGTPLQSFTYMAYPNVNTIIKTSGDTPPNPDTSPPVVSITDPTDLATGVTLNKTITVTMNERILESSVTVDNISVSPTPPGDYQVYLDPLNDEIIKIDPNDDLVDGTTYTVTLLQGGIKDLSDNGIAADFIFSFDTLVIDSTPPTVQPPTDPADLATGVALNKIITITMSEDIDPSSVDITTVSISPSVSTNTFRSSLNNAQIIIDPISDLAEATQYTVTLPAGGVKDLAGNGIASQFQFSFTTIVGDITAPTVQSTDPADTATGVVRSKTILVTMSEPMDANTVNQTNVTISPSVTNNTFLNGADPTQIIINPTVNLDASTLYTVTLIAGGVKDLAGNGIASQFQFDFTTESDAPPPDTTPPTITARNPDSGATGVARGTDVVVDFSEALDPASVHTDSFELFAPGPTKIPAVVTREAGDTRVRLNPNSDLSNSTTYTMFVRTLVKDVAGNSLALEDSWSFTIAANLGITARSPGINATNVPRTTDVVVDFDAVLNPATVTIDTFELFDTSTDPDTEVGLASLTLENSNTRVRLDPSSNLKYSTVYTMFVRSSVADTNGNILGTTSSWSFTVIAPLQITNRVPAVSPGTDVSITTTVVVDFDEALNTGTVTLNSFELFDTSTSPHTEVPASLNLSNGNKRVTLTPTNALKYATTYQMFVRNTVKDVNGDDFGGSDISWTFTTEAQDIVLVYNLSGTSGEWWRFGDTGGGTNDRWGRGLRITSTNISALNALNRVQLKEVRVRARRIGSFSGRDDTMYVRIRSSTGTLKSNFAPFSPVTNISTGSNGSEVKFVNTGNTHILQNGDCVLVEYDDGNDNNHFELQVTLETSSAPYSNEAYTESNGTVKNTSKDMAATMEGVRT